MAAATLWLSLLAPLQALAIVANPPVYPEAPEFTIRRMPMVESPLAPEKLRVTEHVVRLKRENAKSLSSVYVQTMRNQAWTATERDVRLGVSFATVVAAL